MSGTAEAKNFKFCMCSVTKKCKIRPKAIGEGSRNLLLNFGTPSTYRERSRLETYLARILAIRSANEKNLKLGQGVGRGQVTYF